MEKVMLFRGLRTSREKSDRVEVIILQVETSMEKAAQSQSEISTRPTKIKALQNWFEKTQLSPDDFNPDEARWEALKEKHNL